MWSIFENEDFRLEVNKRKEKGNESKNRRKRSYDRMNRSRSFASSRKSFVSFSPLDSQSHSHSFKNSGSLQYAVWKRNMRKRFRTVRSYLLKLARVLSKLPRVEEGDSKEVAVEASLIRKLNKLVEKVDVRKLRKSKRMGRQSSKNQVMKSESLKRRGSSRKSRMSNFFLSLPKDSSLSASKPVPRRKTPRTNLFNALDRQFTRLKRRNIMSGNAGGRVYRRNGRSNYYGYMNIHNRRVSDVNFRDHMNNGNHMMTDFVLNSTLESLSNRAHPLQRKMNMVSISSMNSNYLRKIDSSISRASAQHLKLNSALSRALSPKGSRVYPAFRPLLSNGTHYINSASKRRGMRRRGLSSKELKKFSKEEKIRSLLRTASNEDELLKAMDVAKNAGLTFEAKLGEKKLQKLKTIA